MSSPDQSSKPPSTPSIVSDTSDTRGMSRGINGHTVIPRRNPHTSSQLRNIVLTLLRPSKRNRSNPERQRTKKFNAPSIIYDSRIAPSIWTTGSTPLPLSIPIPSAQMHDATNANVLKML